MPDLGDAHNERVLHLHHAQLRLLPFQTDLRLPHCGRALSLNSCHLREPRHRSLQLGPDCLAHRVNVDGAPWGRSALVVRTTARVYRTLVEHQVRARLPDGPSPWHIQLVVLGRADEFMLGHDLAEASWALGGHLIAISAPLVHHGV